MNSRNKGRKEEENKKKKKERERKRTMSKENSLSHAPLMTEWRKKKVKFGINNLFNAMFLWPARFSSTNTVAVEIQLVMCLKNAWLHWTTANMVWHSAVVLARQQYWHSCWMPAITSFHAMTSTAVPTACSPKWHRAKGSKSISLTHLMWKMWRMPSRTTHG